LGGGHGRIHLNADGGLLIALDGDEADPVDFAELLREEGVGEIVDLVDGDSVGGDGESPSRLD